VVLNRSRTAAARSGIWTWRMCRKKSVSSSRIRAVSWDVDRNLFRKLSTLQAHTYVLMLTYQRNAFKCPSHANALPLLI
jgi:hypothetical protein